MAINSPSLPFLEQSTSYSFYPYPTTPAPTTSLRGPAPPSQSQAGPSRDRIRGIKHAAHIKERAEKRALAGLRPAGFAVGRGSEELDQEEMSAEDERQHINMFGHRFLLPVGRRQTQMELDAAPSPTPSEPDQERRQEDLNFQSPTDALVGENGQTNQPNEERGEESGDDSMIDLDGGIEDMDDDSYDVGDRQDTPNSDQE